MMIAKDVWLLLALILVVASKGCHAFNVPLNNKNGRPLRQLRVPSSTPHAPLQPNLVERTRIEEPNQNEHHKLTKQSTASDKATAVKSALSSVALALTILCASPFPAHAGFGSGGAAVSSFPEIKPLSTEEFMRLSPMKQRQREFSVSCPPNSKLCETGVNRLYKQVRLSNQKFVEDQELQTQLAEMEKRVMGDFNSKYESRFELEESLKAQADLLKKLGDQPPWVSYMAAGIGSIVSTMIMHPVDTIKVQLMAKKNGGEATEEEGEEGLNEDTHEQDNERVAVAYAGITDVEAVSIPSTDTGGVMAATTAEADDVAVYHHPQEDSPEIKTKTKSAAVEADTTTSGIDVSTIYNGLLANVVKEAPSSALYLGIYEFARTILSNSPIGGEPLVVYLLAGAIGELFGSLLRAPAEAVKTRLQVAGGRSSSSDDGQKKLTALDAAREVILTPDGRTNLFQSWSVSLLRDIPMGAVQLAVFESVKTFVINSPDISLDVSSLTSEALFGAIGGSIGAFITTPADIITTISINSLSDEDLAKYRDKNPWEVILMLEQEGGVGALFTGWKERTLYWAPAIGIFLSIYCGSRQFALSALSM